MIYTSTPTQKPNDGNSGPAVVGPFPIGVDNTHNDFDISKNALRDAVNVEITDAGVVRRAKGFRKLFDLAGTRRLFKLSGKVYAIASGTIYALESTPRAVLTISSIAAPLVIVEDDRAYIHDGFTGYILTASGVSAWGVQPVAGLPAVSAISGGSLFSGNRRFAVTRLDADGRESGATQFGSFTSNGGVRFSGLPTGDTIAVYMTYVDGEELYRVGTTTTGSLDVLAEPTGPLLRTEWCLPPMWGQAGCFHNGRLLIAQGGVVAYSKPFADHLFATDEDFLFYTSDVTMVASVDAGVFISADRTYIIKGLGTDAMQQEIISDYPVYPGSLSTGDDGMLYWLTKEGVFAGDKDGSVKKVSSDTFAMPDFEETPTAVLRKDGINGIMSGAGANSVAFTATDFYDIEVVRSTST